MTGLDDAILRAKAYETTGADALFMIGVKTKAELEAIAAATKLPIMLSGADGELADEALLSKCRVKNS